nr:PASTA domain-containing protein [Thermoleophilaceae bacterium]
PKVTDFGIARAGASEMTETGSIMGTAQYLSPEQAAGHPVSEASDVYSIGVMLYELLTGRLPFGGDSAVSIALKHLSEPPPPMSDDSLHIEPNLETVVMGALAKEPEARWQSAEDFAAALEACRPYVEAQMEGMPASGETAVFAAPVAVEREVEVVEREEPRRGWPYVLLALLVLALLGVMAYAFTRPEKVDVPRVVGLQLSEARERLDRRGFERIEVERERSRAPVDTVLRQDPDPGEAAPREDAVKLIVSDGPGKVRVPAVINQPRERATKELNKAGLEVTVQAESSDTVKDGFAIRTSPRADTEVDRNSRVQLYISTGPDQISVPTVVGLTRESAEALITDLGLEVAVEMEESDDAPDGEVLEQSPDSGTRVERGDKVTITVATQPEQVNVPDVTGLSRGDALGALSDAGLGGSVRQRTTDDETEDGVVLEQRPGAGVEVDEGGSVVIIVGRFEEAAVDPGDPGATPGEPQDPATPGEPLAQP